MYFFAILRLPPRSTLFPYTTLFRSTVVLLGHSQRLFRGDREAPRRPPDLGAPHAGPLRGQDPPVVDDAVPLPDGGRDTDRATAAQQRGAGRLSGARRGAGRDAVAAHQLARRDARPAHGRGGP